MYAHLLAAKIKPLRIASRVSKVRIFMPFLDDLSLTSIQLQIEHKSLERDEPIDETSPIKVEDRASSMDIPIPELQRGKRTREEIIDDSVNPPVTKKAKVDSAGSESKGKSKAKVELVSE
jgi:hypothetical protein